MNSKAIQLYLSSNNTYNSQLSLIQIDDLPSQTNKLGMFNHTTNTWAHLLYKSDMHAQAVSDSIRDSKGPSKATFR